MDCFENEKETLFNNEEELLAFVTENNIRYATNRLREKMITSAGMIMGVVPGEQLRHYLLRYGHLENDKASFIGINTENILESKNMMDITQKVHKFFPETRGYACFGGTANPKNSKLLLYLVDSDDIVHLYSNDEDLEKTMVSTNETLFDFMAKQLVRPELMHCKQCDSDYISLRVTCPYCGASKIAAGVLVTEEAKNADK